MRYRLTVSYDGACFNGWQKQSEGPPTVQGTLEEILTQLSGAPVRVIGSGRTDSGVHAVAQTAHFESDKVFDRGLLRGLNALAPDGLVTKAAMTAPDDFHAVASAVSKTYIYRIWNAPLLSVFHRRGSFWIPKQIDLARLNQLSAGLIGERDFKSFQTKGTPVTSTVRTVTEARWRVVSGNRRMVEFRISGSGFLKQMVRNIVGTLLYLERKGLGPDALESILAAFDRQAAKATAPPHGLYLLGVQYPASLDNQCRKL